MLKTKLIVDYLKTNGQTHFEEIWKDIKEDIIEEINDKELEENTIKSNIFLSMIQDFNLIMIGGNIWNAKENYSLEESEKINSSLYENLEEISENEVDFENVEQEKENVEEIVSAEERVNETENDLEEIS